MIKAGQKVELGMKSFVNFLMMVAIGLAPLHPSVLRAQEASDTPPATPPAQAR
jgi:hypothetical protein